VFKGGVGLIYDSMFPKVGELATIKVRPERWRSGFHKLSRVAFSPGIIIHSAAFIYDQQSGSF
jgi:hypothetical protein